MNAIEILRTAFGNAFRSKLRTTLTILAIFVGSFTLTLTNGVGTGINDYIDTQLGSMGSPDVMVVGQARGDGNPFGGGADGPAVYDPDRVTSMQGFQLAALTERDLDALRAIDGVRSVEPLRSVVPDFVQWRDGTRYAFQVNPAGVGGSLDLVAGRAIRADDGRAVLLPVSYVEPLGFQDAEAAVGATVTIGISDVSGRPHQLEAEVVGVQQATLFDLGAIVSATMLTDLHETQATGMPASFRNVYAAATARFDVAAEASVKAALAASGYRGQTMADQLGTVTTVIDAIVAVLNAFAIIALVAAGFGIVNTLLMAVQERTREIGLMKAMGMSRRGLFALFSAEALVIGFLGSALGSVVAIALGSVVAELAARGPLAPLAGLRVLAFDPLAVATVIGLVMLLAFLAGTLPAARAAGLDPIDALRYE